MHETHETEPFVGLVDLAAERLGGQAVQANDEFFAPKENLLKPGRGVFIPDKYTDRGKWMDGWETRRRRTPGYDWCIVRLGLPGLIRGVDIDTNHFLGNHPPHASLDACAIADEETLGQASWTGILPQSPLEPGSQNLFSIDSDRRWTHVRLNIYPDGGVARLRVYGEVMPDWEGLDADAVIDLAAIGQGGTALACSDRFFSPMMNLLMPGPSQNMGDGWETRRRRGPGYDWVVVRLGCAGFVHRIHVETTHFKGNYPDRCRLEGCYAPEASHHDFDPAVHTWTEILPETKLQADHCHVFEEALATDGPFTHIRLNIYPDGGVARLRVFGMRASAMDATP